MPVIVNGSGSITGINWHLGTDGIVRTNSNSINENITIPVNINGMTARPVTVASSYTVTVNGTWTIV